MPAIKLLKQPKRAKIRSTSMISPAINLKTHLKCQMACLSNAMTPLMPRKRVEKPVINGLNRITHGMLFDWKTVEISFLTQLGEQGSLLLQLLNQSQIIKTLEQKVVPLKPLIIQAKAFQKLKHQLISGPKSIETTGSIPIRIFSLYATYRKKD